MQALKHYTEKIESVLERAGAKRIEAGLAVLITLIGMTLFAFVVYGGNTRTAFSFIQNIELRSLDARFTTRGPRAADDRIVIVGIDEKTLQKLGAYPIPRDGYAKTVDILAQGGAKVVAFDVAFPTPEKNSAVEALKRLETEIGGMAPAAVIEKIRAIEATSDHDKALAESLKKADNVVLGHLFLDEGATGGLDNAAMEDYFNILWGKPFPQMQKLDGNFDMGHAWKDVAKGQVVNSVYSNIRLLAESAKSYGFYDNNPDNDGTMRRALLLVRYRDRDFFPSLAFQTIREYENVKDQSIVGYMGREGLERIEMGPHTIKTNGDGTVDVNFTGPYHSYKHYSMADILDGTVPPETFKGKIVLLGATAKGIGDLRNTPFGKQDVGYMGVEIHANVIDNFLHNEERGRGFLTRGYAEEGIDLLFILSFGLGLGIFFSRVKPLYSTISVLGVLAFFSSVVYLAFARYGMWLHFVVPAGTLVANYATITSFRMIFEEREKRKVRKNFSTYVSPGVIGLIEKDPKKYFKAGGETKELTVMFSDIRSFTTIAEGLSADELVYLLNEYLGEMTDIIFKRWGTLDKYIGDAIMAFWGSPFPQADHAVRACAAALEMQARLEELNLKWEMEGRKQLSIGVGLNTGIVNVGNMGSSKRLAWTVMGDNVNLSSRLEGTTKEYHAKILLGEGTYKYAKDEFVCREVDKIRVKGKLQPVSIYELLAFGKEAPAYREQLGLFDSAYDAFKRRQWDEAVQKFETLLARYPKDGPAQVLLQRSLEFVREAPAPSWDGVYVMKTK